MITTKPLVTDKYQKFWSSQKECAIKYLKDLNILPNLSYCKTAIILKLENKKKLFHVNNKSHTLEGNYIK